MSNEEYFLLGKDVGVFRIFAMMNRNFNGYIFRY